jgi:hypothetical protein
VPANLNELRSWRNWQTHQLEGLAVAIPWWFESTRPHQFFLDFLYWLSRFVKSETIPAVLFRLAVSPK